MYVVERLTDDADVLNAFEQMIRDKATKTEAEIGVVDPVCLGFVRAAYAEVMAADMDELPARGGVALGSEDLREILNIEEIDMTYSVFFPVEN